MQATRRQSEERETATDGEDLAALAAAYLDLWERLSAERALAGPDPASSMAALLKAARGDVDG